MDGDISNYHPDFQVKLSDKKYFIVEKQRLAIEEVPQKMKRLRHWYEDINRVQSEIQHDFAYVDEEGFSKYKPGVSSSLFKISGNISKSARGI